MFWLYLLIAAGVAFGVWRWLASRPASTKPVRAVMRPSGESILPQTAEYSAARPVRQETLLAAFRSDEMPILRDADHEDQQVLVRALALAADHLGATHCVLWRLDLSGEPRVEVVAASRGNGPTLDASSMSVILWSAQETVMAGDTGSERSVRLLTVPVTLHEGPGAVSAHFGEDPLFGRTVLREWLTRHASGIATLQDLVRTRADTARRNYKLRATVRTAKTLQSSRDPMALEQMLVRDSLVVSGATWAMLVRWDESQRLGEVKHVTDQAPSFGLRVTARPGSLVGNACVEKKNKPITDTRPLLAARDPVFDDAPLPEGTGSLLVVPLQRSDQEPVLAALVCGHPDRKGLQPSDAAALRELGVIAAGALETAWAVQAETERARTDQLTGLSNRRHFEEAFHRMIGETDRYGGSAGLILADVDHFKKVNDTYGHEAGDQVLVAVARALQGERRTTDFVARVGGEELAILLPQTDGQGVMEVAERCRVSIERLVVRTATGEIRVTSSFGVAMYTARSGNGNKLYDRADKALYAAKHGGRNRVELAASDGAWSA